jgi:hypothetical protein
VSASAVSPSPRAPSRVRVRECAAGREHLFSLAG